MNKELIKQRFKRKLKSYNKNARIQKQMAERILEYLPEKEYSSVLEIGCGTGLLTEKALNKINYSEYTALDIISDCEAYIKKLNDGINFINCDIEEYIEKTDKTYDLIISNAALQWIENLPEFIKKMMGKLNPQGVLLFSTFGKENFREIYFVLGKTLPYYSSSELKELLSAYSTQTEEEIRVMAFKTPKEVLKHIQNTGVNAISKENWTKRDLTNFEAGYNSFCANNPTLTYNPVYVLIKNTSK